MATGLASFIFMVMCIHYLYKCVSRRLWLFPCYPAPFMSLGAGTLGLVAFSTKPHIFPHGELNSFRISLIYTVAGSVLASGLICVCMPSIATADRSQMWSNAGGAALLLATIIFNILYKQIYRKAALDLFFLYIKDYAFDSKYTMVALLCILAVCLSLAILILMVQACTLDLMISDVAACVSIRLQELDIMYPISSISERGGLYNCWISWEDMERRTYVKLMMGLTSNLQNVASRSPLSAILGISFLVTAAAASHALLITNGGVYLMIVSACTHFVSILGLGIICVSRWLRLAVYDDRSLRSLLLDRHPFYWHQKMTNIWHQLKAGPPRPLQPASIRRLTTFTLKFILYCISTMVLLSFIIPIFWIFVVFVRSTHAFTTLLVRMLKSPLGMMKLPLRIPIKALRLCLKLTLGRCAPSEIPAVEADSAPPYACLNAGVIHITGEDPCTVNKLFASSAKLAIQRQMKKARTKSIVALETLLKLSTQACFFDSSVVSEVLDQRGKPDAMSMALHVGCHYGGDYYGWSLTALSLLVVMSKVEVQAFGTSKRTSAAMEAYEQALQMVRVVDEMHAPTICSKEIYLKASASMWFSLLRKSRSWPAKASSRLGQVNVAVVDILDGMLKSALSQLEGHAHVFPWAMEVVQAYTMYTVCQNLRRWCTSIKDGGGICPVEHIEFLIAEVLAGCLCSLPAVLEARTRKAVHDGQVAVIESAILLICQAQQMWRKLEWPQCNLNIVDAFAPGFSLNQHWLQCKRSTHAGATPELHRLASWP